MSQRFIRCYHCGLPHHLTDEVCPVTGKPIRKRRKSLEQRAAEQPRQEPQPEDSEVNAMPIPLVSQRQRQADPQRGQRGSAPSPLPPRAEPYDGELDHSLIGRIISDKYRVLGLIGEGGMGTVYEAEHLEIGRHVAIKVLNRAHLGRKEAVARFYQEARAAGAIGHPNICEIYDVGRLGDGSPYLVMERLHGKTLADRINLEGALAFEDVISFVTQVLSALVAAHEKNIIHRDIKPENIFLTERVGCAPVAKILDFGISKTGNANSELSLTRTGMVMGTPFYMAPEQARGESIDHRVDLYACGVMLYEALTGRRPFVASNYNALVVQVLSAQPRDPRDIRPAIPSGFVPIIYKALSKRREDRFDNATTFISALSKLGDELGRGPSIEQIKKLAEEVRRISTRPPPMPGHRPASSPPPMSDSMDIPVTFSETGTGAQSAGLQTGEVQVDMDTGGSPAADNSPTEVGSNIAFDGARKGRRTGPQPRRTQPSETDEEVHDTIVDPSGAILGELWSHMERGPAPAAVAATPPSKDAAATVRTEKLDAASAAAVLARIDDPAFASTEADEPGEDDDVEDGGRYSMISSFPLENDDDDDDDNVFPAILKRQHVEADESERTTQRPARDRSSSSGQPVVGAAPQRAPRPSGMPPPSAEAKKAGKSPAPPAPRPAPAQRNRSMETPDPEDDAVTTLFVSSDDGPREANGNGQGDDDRVRGRQDSNSSIPRAPRPPGTPRL